MRKTLTEQLNDAQEALSEMQRHASEQLAELQAQLDRANARLAAKDETLTKLQAQYSSIEHPAAAARRADQADATILTLREELKTINRSLQEWLNGALAANVITPETGDELIAEFGLNRPYAEVEVEIRAKLRISTRLNPSTDDVLEELRHVLYLVADDDERHEFHEWDIRSWHVI